MERLYHTYKDSVEFFLVYIREAHPDSVLFVEKDGQQLLETISQTQTLVQRRETAQICTASLHLSIPTIVDRDDNRVNEAYGGWPDRMAVVGLDGKIAYYGRKGPGGFRPDEVEQWLTLFAPTKATN